MAGEEAKQRNFGIRFVGEALRFSFALALSADVDDLDGKNATTRSLNATSNRRGEAAAENLFCLVSYKSTNILLLAFSP